MDAIHTPARRSLLSRVAGAPVGVLLTAALLVGGLGCSSGGGSGAGAGGGNDTAGGVGDVSGDASGGEDVNGGQDVSDEDGSGTIPSAWRACAQDDDCALVELGCCDHCNGGDLVSVHKDHTGDLDAYKATGCELVDCTAMGCEPKVAVCGAAGLCSYEGDGTWGTGCAGLGEAACKANDACVAVSSNDPVAACDGALPWGPQKYAGCVDAGMGCAAVESCAFNETTGEHRMFGGCVPSSWEPAAMSACCGAASPTCTADASLTAIGQLCIRGAPSPDAGVEQIDVGLPIEVQIRPEGCWSSSCTKQVAGWCAVAGEGTLREVAGGFCLGKDGDPGGGCTDDCGGGGQAFCPLNVSAKGTLTLQAGAVKLQVEVPSQLPPGGKCVGAPF